MIYSLNHFAIEISRPGKLAAAHTDISLFNVSNLNDVLLVKKLSYLRIKKITSGTGERFWELAMSIAKLLALPQDEIEWFSDLGTNTSRKRRNGSGEAYVGNGRKVPLERLHPKGELISFRPWEFLEFDVQPLATGNILLCTGSEFMESLNIQHSKMGDVHRIDLRKKDVKLVWEFPQQ